MKLATSTSDFSIIENQEERLVHLYEAGFRYADFSMYSQSEVNFIMDDGWEERIKAYKKYADNLKIKFVQAHSPDISYLCGKYSYEEAIEITKRSFVVCRLLEIKNTVVHSFFCYETKEEFFEKNKEFYEKLLPCAEETGVNILVENSTAANQGKNYPFATGRDMKEFVQLMNHPLLHACWDTGHANIEGHQYEDIVALGDDLYALHINDNYGKRDQHQIPYIGNMSIDEIMCGLKEIGYSGVFTFETWLTVVAAYRRRKYDATQKLLNAPMFIYDDIEKLLYKTGEYILETYGLSEEKK